MTERSIKSAARDRNLQLQQEQADPMMTKIFNNHLGQSSSLIIVTLISSLILVVVLIAFAIVRYNRRCQTLTNNSYSITRYWRRQLPSNSLDQLVSPPFGKEISSNDETTRILKNSFSWPEATLIHQQPSTTQRQYSAEHDQTDSCSTRSSISTSSTLEQITEPASLTFSLRWHEQTKSLIIRLINARNLFLSRRFRSTNLFDTYIRIELISTDSQETFPLMRTHIVKKNLHPTYDELFEYSPIFVHQEKEYSLRLTLLTYDTFTRDEILGQIDFLIDQWNDIRDNELTLTKEITPRHIQFSQQSLGQMLISLCYQPSDRSITLIVLKVTNLPRLDSRRLLNPYFKIYMFYKGQRLMKKRSTIKRTTQSPVYNECFVFPIPENDLFHVHFDLILFDYDSHMKHEPIGMISIGKTSDETNQQWTDICHRQLSKQMAQWYPLKLLTKFN